MRRTTALVLLLGLVGAVAACGGDSEPVDTGQEPGGSAEIAVKVSVGGGFVPQGADFMSVPTIVLGDGTVFTGGAITLQYPGPPVLPVLTGSMSSADVDGLIAAARAAGLDRDGVDYGRPNITDVGTTMITVVIDGEEHVADVYALGFDGPTGPEGTDGSQEMDGLTDEQRAARAAVEEFVTDLTDQVSAAATDTLEPTGYQVLSFTTEPASVSTEEPRPNELEWPADIPSSALGKTECFDLAGDHADAFTAALADATSITVWRDASGATWHLSVRATLPGDEPCPIAVADDT